MPTARDMFGKIASGPTRPAVASAVRQSSSQRRLNSVEGANDVGDLGETAKNVGSLRLVGNAADIVSGIIGKGALGGMSVASMVKYSQRAMEAFSKLGQENVSGTHTSARSFSQQPLLSSVDKDTGMTGFQQRMQASTNSFFKGGNKWWDNAISNRGTTGEPWSAANDTGLGATRRGGYNFGTDRGLGYVAPKTAWEYSGTDESRLAGVAPQVQNNYSGIPADELEQYNNVGLAMNAYGAGNSTLNKSFYEGLSYYAG